MRPVLRCRTLTFVETNIFSPEFLMHLLGRYVIAWGTGMDVVGAGVGTCAPTY